MDTSTLDDIHHFWFGDIASPTAADPARIQKWMRQSDAFDDEIRQRYAHLLPEAAAQTWNLDALTPRQAVALVVLLDQFPRNLFRTTGEAFAYDHLSREFARTLIKRGLEPYAYIERFMLFLPIQHSEDVADQDWQVFLHADVTVNGPPPAQMLFRNALDFATKHRDLIRKFGRYPHRNVMLGRESTPEELAFLKDHGRGF